MQPPEQMQTALPSPDEHLEADDGVAEANKATAARAIMTEIGRNAFVNMCTPY
jgi:hypothetical protein